MPQRAAEEKSGNATYPVTHSGRAMPLTIKRQLRTPAAANGSNRIALSCLPLHGIDGLTCQNDLY
jgi:hypothetical protein